MAGTRTASRFVGEGAPQAVRTTTLVELERFVDTHAEHARRAMVVATRRRAVRQQLHGISRDHAIDRARSVAHAADAPAVTFTRQLLRLWRAGANYAELTQLAMVPIRAVMALAGDAPRCLDQIDIEETRLSAEENRLQMRRRVHQPTATSLREEAALCELLEAQCAERARALRLQADVLERSRGMVA